LANSHLLNYIIRMSLFISMNNYSNSENKQKAVAKLAAKVMGDRQLMSMLSNKVYQLMLDDLRLQKERHHNYGRS
jgi:hypothetical protein